MRSLVLGDPPRRAQFADLLRLGHHTVVDNPADAQAIFLVQRAAGDTPVTRHEAVQALHQVVPYITEPCTICLVSLEPNIAWPIGMCHVVRTSLAMAAAKPYQVTRAHLTELETPDFDKLILGAKADGVAALEAAFAPLVPAHCSVHVTSLYEAERDAEYRPEQARLWYI